ncbi:MAG: 3-oxoacyl-[acyl-carrier-protein] reductase [Oligoflexia bacterium]|nr:3-oxoacyl-[acyl-carrier-protein] reductase [Oligoflexia bacterium]
MNFNFADKVVVVTGASRGIGKAIAQNFSKTGAKLAVIYNSNEEAAEKSLKELSGSGHKKYKINVADSKAVEESFERIKSEMGGFHFLINNAGVTQDQILLRMKEEDWDKVIQTNLKSVFNCTKMAVKFMLKERTGSIVNITSVIGQTGNAGQSNYAASKAGIIGFTKSIAVEVASRNIRLNCIAPGFIKSDMTDSLTEEQKNKIIQKVPLGSIGEPDDVAAACLFLCSDFSRYITGQTLNVNGGLYMN